MCQIMLTICHEGRTVHWVRMRYCELVRDNFPELPEEWTCSKIRGTFSWSPMEGCMGLTIENPVIIDDCGSGAAWSSDQEMDDDY